MAWGRPVGKREPPFELRDDTVLEAATTGVRVEPVPMDGVHVGSQPEARIGECEPHGTQGFGERAEWAVRVRRSCLLEAQPPTGDPAEERPGKM
jgi:hypothetical protein